MRTSPLVVSVPEAGYAAELADLDDVEVVVWEMDGPPPDSAPVELAVLPYMSQVDLATAVAGVDSLRVLQLQSAGYEQYADHVPAGVRLCNGAGIHDASTSELALALILAAQRDLPELFAAQRHSRWEPGGVRGSLADRRIVVIGYGQIGRAIVRRLLPFEVTVTAVASRPRAGDSLVDRVHGIDELHDLAGDADVLVVIVPLTDATRGLVDAGLLARLPDQALVVNVARGPIVDTDALVAECAAGRLRAALDVTDPEPLPHEHPLWSTPGVILTPHVGGATTAMRPRALALIRRQIVAVRDGRELANVVVG